jgi:integrase
MGFLIHGKYNYVYLTFYILNKKYRYSTKIKVNRSEWDLSIQRPKVRRGAAGEQNRKITHELNEYQRAFDTLKEKYKESLTKEIVKEKFNIHFHLAQTVKKLTYSDYFEIYIEQKKNSRSVQKDSWQKYTRIHTGILEMQKKSKRTYYLQSFDNAFLMDFISYFRNQKNISDNTLRRKIGFFKSFLNWCVNNGYSVNTAYKTFNIKPRETSHVSLTDAELKILEDIELDEALSYYRDLFLIGIYSGQRYSDYGKFDKDDIDGDNIVIRAKKTGQFSYVPLNSKLKRILNKYDWELKKIASQNFNINIQKICKIAGFDEIIKIDKFYGNKKVSKKVPRWKLIGSHTARRTFITLSAQRNVPLSLIMQVTGIKSVKTLQGYIKFDKEKLNKSIFEAWN